MASRARAGPRARRPLVSCGIGGIEAVAAFCARATFDCNPRTEISALDAASGVGKVEPDFHAAGVRAFRADGSSHTGAEMAGRANVARELWMDFAYLRDFV